MKHLLTSFFLVSLLNNSIAQSGGAAKLQDPASLIEPIRWENPLNPAEFDKIQNCRNYEKYGFMPGMTREQILIMHSDCCFNNNSKIIAIILVIIAMILIPVAIVKLIGIKNE